MTRLPLESGGTLLTHTATKPGTGIFIEENPMGAWVYGDARSAGSFSATVMLLTNETNIAGACAYASSYPPLGKYVSATEISFTGTPMYEITLVYEDGNTFETIKSGGTFLLPCSYTVSSFTDRTGAPGILSCIPSADIYNLTVSAMTYCAGDAVTFALDNTTSGRTYQLYKDGDAVMDELLSTGGGATFTGTFAGAGEYTARVKDNGTYCAVPMTGVHVITADTPPTAPTGLVSNVVAMTCFGEPATLTANGGSVGSGAVYEWGTGSTVGNNMLSPATTTANTYAVSLSVTPTYWVRLKGTTGACSTVATEGVTTTVYTEPAPVGTFAAFTDNASTYVTLTDERDGKGYPVVKIGGRWIMARSLNYQAGLTWQANADSPSTSFVPGSNPALIGSFWCPGGSSASATTSTLASCDVWGAFYSWETAMLLDGYGTWTEVAVYNTGAANLTNSQYNHGRTAHSGTGTGGRGICPPNWHVPTDYEWGVLLDVMESDGGTAHQTIDFWGWVGIDVGARVKSKCTVADHGSTGDMYVNDTQANWYYNSGTLGTDDYDFHVLPSGLRLHSGSGFFNRGRAVYFWSSSAFGAGNALYRVFDYEHANGHRSGGNSRTYGYSVRCIRN
jgi:uncharacterized protein (TIGR02145 family)